MNTRDTGLLILRLGIGIMFMLHGYPKLTGGAESWTGLGQAMGTFGITFAPAFWGFMAALAEFGGGICLILGVGFKIACILMGITMLVAAAMHLNKGDGIPGAAHAIELMVVFLGLLFTGPGRFSLGKAIPYTWLR
ncbi:MAG: DoxX family protein [Lentisphaerae bacterium]|nr:DoxX family protein [Lentisphaerota bacterium]